MRWWYASIADWMLANPDKTLTECAQYFNKHLNTISRITHSDTFKAYLAQRRREFQADFDARLTGRLGDVALKSMEAITDIIDKKGDSLRIDTLTELMSTSLEALGFGKPVTPAVQVNQTLVDQSQHVTLPLSVSPAALEEARQALRVAEARRGMPQIDVLPSAPPVALEAVEAPTPLVGGASTIEKDQE